MSGGADAAAKHAQPRSATIRSVPSYEDSESSPDSRRSAFASSVDSAASASSPPMPAAAAAAPQCCRRPSASVRLKGDAAAADDDDTPVKWSPKPSAARVQQQDASPPWDGPDADASQWDSTIGKAGLGKTGRVINKLVGDNDALKRDIRIERLRAHEAKEAAKLLEDKMDRLVGDYEARLLEASVTKTLLARKERQLATLTQTVEVERSKAAAALERERSWRRELDRVKAESALHIDEATAYAHFMEGRYNAISSHWRDHGDDVKRALARIRGDIGAIVDERRADDDKMRTLRDLCDQQDSNIRQLRRERDAMACLFDEYKKTQEDDLRDIRLGAARREQEQERLLDESRRALDKLKWALNVKENVRHAQ